MQLVSGKQVQFPPYESVRPEQGVVAEFPHTGLIVGRLQVQPLDDRVEVIRHDRVNFTIGSVLSAIKNTGRSPAGTW